ncbi:MAG: DNA-binding protein WhiA [Oscillospiraceae bacterium]
MSDEISFSHKVKEEIISKINSKSKADACLLGILMTCNEISNTQILFLTENESVAEFFIKNIQRICGNQNAIEELTTSRKNSNILYNLSINNVDDIRKIFEYFKIDLELKIENTLLPKKKFYPQLISGVFLSCGSVNNPEKKYHLEFVLPTLGLCNLFGALIIDNFNILPKQAARKNHQIVYIKESENIIDMLTIMGAVNSSFDFMNTKIFKDMRNKINRAVNCDNANIEKSLKAAEKQIEDIELIDNTIGIDSLPENLQEIARMRYENPDYTLQELSQALNPPISRSGANHRLARIADVASDIRNKNNGEIQ